MTFATRVVNTLVTAGWVVSGGGTSEGFRVTQGKGCVIVSWVSPAWNAKTMERMLRNYEKTLQEYDVTRLRSHLIVK